MTTAVGRTTDLKVARTAYLLALRLIGRIGGCGDTAGNDLVDAASRKGLARTIGGFADGNIA